MKDIRMDLPKLTILKDEPLSHFTYTKTGGPADFIVFPKEKKEVKEIVDYATHHHISWIVLGNASNLIVKDGGIRGIVILLTKMNDITVTKEKITAFSGAKLIDVSQKALDYELTGLEFACGIPGSIGGAVFMNAGAYGSEIQETVDNVEVLTASGEFKTYTKEDMHFSYRYSKIQDTKDIVLSASFQLKKGKKEEIKRLMEDLTEKRTSKQPLEYPSCGSVFKRPEGHFTGKLIQDAQLQGKTIGGAQISKKHAGFIVNINHATATDYIDLIQFIQKEIYAKFKVQLEPEVRILGEDKKE